MHILPAVKSAIIFALILCSYRVFASDVKKRADQCTASMADASGTVVDADALTKNVQIIWYPMSAYILLSHVEVEVDGTLWKATGYYNKSKDLSVVQRAALGGGRGYVSFSLRVSPAEFEKMKSFVESRKLKPSFNMCSGGACRVVTKNSGIVIPWPIALVPTVMAAYLTVAKMVGYKRIESVSWIGPKKMSDLNLKQWFFSLGLVAPAAESVFAYALGYDLILQVKSATGQLIDYIVPVLHNLFVGEEFSPSESMGS